VNSRRLGRCIASGELRLGQAYLKSSAEGAGDAFASELKKSSKAGGNPAELVRGPISNKRSVSGKSPLEEACHRRRLHESPRSVLEAPLPTYDSFGISPPSQTIRQESQ
jgi:hypothetical protein